MKRTDHTHAVDAHLERVSDLRQQQRTWEIRHNNAVRNSPHLSGTTTELAAALSVSKGEVRRLKREGRLEAALNDLPPTTKTEA